MAIRLHFSMTMKPASLVVIDTSALVAIATREPEREKFLYRCLNDDSLQLSSAGYLEVAIVLDNRSDPILSKQLDQLLERLSISVVPVTPDQARIARRAHREYGRGSGHPARLNFGDCFSYALSKDTGEPLLFKGDDFSRTDVIPAI
jgi:ribonuclease VapC